jgi:hypothetical protein
VSETLTHDQASLVERLEYLTLKIKQLTQDAEDTKAQLREELGEGEYTYAGTGRLTIHENYRFSQDKARDVLPVDVYDSLLVPHVDTAAAKATLSPEMYSRCQAPTGGKASVKVVST